jgi:hypothetical protein
MPHTVEALSRRGKRHRAKQGSINVLPGVPHGHRWRHVAKSPSPKPSSTVWGLLRNPAYQGRARHGKTEFRPRQRNGLAGRNGGCAGIMPGWRRAWTGS